MNYADRNGRTIDVEKLLEHMGDSKYVTVESDYIKTSSGDIFILTYWTADPEKLFETRVVGGKISGYSVFAGQELDALVQHKETVEMVKEVIEYDHSGDE